MQIISGEINFLTRKKSLHLETFKPFLTHALTERLNHLKKDQGMVDPKISL